MPDEHWRQYPPDDEPGWLDELRRRTHELANEISKLRALVQRAEARVQILEAALQQRQTRVDQGVGEVVAVVSHTLIVIALVTAAVVLQVTGNDSALAWGALGGYLGGAGVQKATGVVTSK